MVAIDVEAVYLTPELADARLHMAIGDSFPIAAEVVSPWFAFTAARTARTASAGDVVPVDMPMRPDELPAILTEVPYVNAAPVEGTPFAGWPSWSEGRRLTGSDAGGLPGALLLSLAYPGTRGGSAFGDGSLRVMEQEAIAISARFALPAGDDATTEHTRTQTRILGRPLEVTDSWHRTDGEAARTEGAERCSASSVPLWDLARRVEESGLAGEFQGMHLERRGGPGVPMCTGAADVLRVLGDAIPAPGLVTAQIHETVHIDMHTGLLRAAHVLER